ncbi:MAG: hypothetical protein WEB19_05430 [Acidimicrobiia bacterium]
MTREPPHAREAAERDFNDLLREVLPFVREMLEGVGDVMPYAVVVTVDGAIDTVGAAIEHRRRRPHPDRVRQEIFDEVRLKADDFRAVAFVNDLQTEGIRAILVEFEHRDGTSLSTWVPYAKQRRRGPVVFGELQASDGHPKLWAPE